MPGYIWQDPTSDGEPGKGCWVIRPSANDDIGVPFQGVKISLGVTIVSHARVDEGDSHVKVRTEIRTHGSTPICATTSTASSTTFASNGSTGPHGPTRFCDILDLIHSRCMPAWMVATLNE